MNLIGDLMNILKGRLNKREMSRFIGVKPREVDKSLAKIAGMGYISYFKAKDKYSFIVFPEPVKETEL